MEKILLKNGKFVLANRIVSGDLLIIDGKIKKITEKENPLYENGIDLKGKYVVPGFIDAHIHGAYGADAMDGTVEALKTISSFVVKHGTTNFLATTLTSTKEILKNVLEKVAEVQDKELDGANIFGAHMEGPYFDIQYKGAQNEKYMKPAGIEEIKEYLSVKPGLVKLFSLSPKDETTLEAIKFLKENGVVVSVGHSAVNFDDVQKAIKAGLSHSTHTYNGMRGFTHREPGVVGAVLTNDAVMAEIIFDKIHVHPEAVRLLLKAKGVDKVECITDAMSATGLPDGNYKLGELDVYVKDSQARLVSNDSLAGSVLTLDKAFKNVIELGYSIFDAVKMTSTNAAKEFGLNTGEISEGKDADLVVLNDDYSVDMTFVKGKLKYQA
ncbi:N-acetylglucosamine-6-phosphate deacetylase [Fusobacterium ulcerans]|jgi:N-acetylglucosamine-6-phosphate deacetylase|uniref:N-acetylglucosamine-6-phosphate deacetylase n=1 Tax=Fusobacterium ulcerans 12-1B TaxID=457404 RepID=S2LGK2_9FUSO|nr:N-acetylglucosamine-6-phosphate deacetylase [Fusobacterium ulcerans]EPC09191.1 N-acetylglucosamine-6-phosphate deacetylase [Fusobacterium ulcerans 12-1B]MCB8564852.1 N-acetylglucosamine-6-phosphate deacetylase [Fusobacterium ulcerans]MCB8648780.1 N-acetylglucosamine-6-phosphate deacetylase [Fusobacterium ulcerans]MEE0139093.1 N-acetylglucosamine-6-phosphate deacetylase [Fusobacterium ulcerans]RGY66115.1 N-acetylglucosamine-6-phosphate deacetylase [Fusobacterium ulcerans]